MASLKEIHEKAYTCNICDDVFTSNKILNAHMLLIHGPKKYKCDKCVKTLRHPCGLKVHQAKCH